jgi:hypothetical protein
MHSTVTKYILVRLLDINKIYKVFINQLIIIKKRTS